MSLANDDKLIEKLQEGTTKHLVKEIARLEKEEADSTLIMWLKELKNRRGRASDNNFPMAKIAINSMIDIINEEIEANVTEAVNIPENADFNRGVVRRKEKLINDLSELTWTSFEMKTKDNITNTMIALLREKLLDLTEIRKVIIESGKNKDVVKTLTKEIKSIEKRILRP